MIQIQQPVSLFGKQKVYKINSPVEKENWNKPAGKKTRAVVLYHHPAAELPAAVSAMLGKLIGACKFAEDETLLLNQTKEPVSIGYLQSQYEPELILVFGEVHLSKNITKLRKNFPYEINGTKIIQTESLENLEKIKGAKGQLWEVLKQSLSIS